ncbi:MAG TPA: hypothetical protein VJ914_03250 [Pseudonocardiaceae bacterium]|nr:hypothetical protein [Pseudonocardiaceae bacterium]
MRQLGEVDGAHRKCVDEVQIWGVGDSFLEALQLGSQSRLLFAEFRSSLVEVADHLLVWLVHEFQIPDQALAVGGRVLDHPSQRLDLGQPISLRLSVKLFEQRSAVEAEDALVEERRQAIDEAGFADPVAGLMPLGGVATFRCTGVVAEVPSGLPVEAPATLVAEQVRTALRDPELSSRPVGEDP